MGVGKVNLSPSQQIFESLLDLLKSPNSLEFFVRVFQKHPLRVGYRFIKIVLL